MGNDKVLVSFDSLFMYDTSIKTDSEGRFYCARRKIKVEQEVIASGAMHPTYLVRYPDNSKAYVSKDMYSTSPQVADELRLQELYETMNIIDEQLSELQNNRRRVDAMIQLLLPPQ
jgi:hypothetical protein